MTVTSPTSHQIAELAEARTTQFYGPKDPRPGYSPAAWAEERRTFYANQVENAKIELTRKYERARDREEARAASAKQQADDREAELRRRFDQRFPGGSDADYRAMRPTLLAELSTEAAQADEAARETMRRRLRSAF